MVRKILIRLALFILIVAGAGWVLFMIYINPFLQKMKHTSTLNYDPKLTLVLGGGGNSGILVSDSAVLVIDTKMREQAEELAKKVKILAGNKRIIIVNTHIHVDHTEGNKYYANATIIACGNYDKAFWIRENGNAGVPTVWVKDSLIIPMGDETVTIYNLPWAAHTQSDLFVYLQHRKMLFGGDVILNKQAPAMLDQFRADPYGYLRAFDSLSLRFNIEKVVPGHGEIGGPEVISDFKNFFIDMKVASLDQAKEKELLEKYKDWNQIPFIMSPKAAEERFKKR